MTQNLSRGSCVGCCCCCCCCCCCGEKAEEGARPTWWFICLSRSSQYCEKMRESKMSMRVTPKKTKKACCMSPFLPLHTYPSLLHVTSDPPPSPNGTSLLLLLLHTCLVPLLLPTSSERTPYSAQVVMPLEEKGMNGGMDGQSCKGWRRRRRRRNHQLSPQAGSLSSLPPFPKTLKVDRGDSHKSPPFPTPFSILLPPTPPPSFCNVGSQGKEGQKDEIRPEGDKRESPPPSALGNWYLRMWAPGDQNEVRPGPTLYPL